MEISTNIKAIDTIKSEILSEVASLYRALADYDEVGEYENVSNSIATIIAMDYILARRLGLGFKTVDGKIKDLLTIAEENNHELEVAFSDMSELKKYMGSR